MNQRRGPRAKAIAIDLGDVFFRRGGGGGGFDDDPRDPTGIEKKIREYAEDLISQERRKLEGKLPLQAHRDRLQRDRELDREFDSISKDTSLRGTWNAVKVIFKYEFASPAFNPA